MRFTLAIWVASRIALAVAFWVAAPHHAIAALGNWDGAWYGSIVEHGYEFSADGRQHNTAFFPLFPLLGAFAGRAGIAWPLAGVLIDNAAFLAAVVAIYAYAEAAFDARSAKWTAAITCLAPLSLFGSLAYAEGLFMLCSALSLLCYRRKLYVWAGVTAALASAARPLGAFVAPAIVLAALWERKRVQEVLCCALGFCGVAAFAAYCALRFHDPLAFVHAQLAWRHSGGFDPAGWAGVARGASHGSAHDAITFILLVCGVVTIAIFRRRIGLAGVAYVILCIACIILAGTPYSADRNLYTIVPMLAALGAILRRLPVVGYAALAASAVLLLIDATRFAHFLWVA